MVPKAYKSTLTHGEKYQTLQRYSGSMITTIYFRHGRAELLSCGTELNFTASIYSFKGEANYWNFSSKSSNTVVS